MKINLMGTRLVLGIVLLLAGTAPGGTIGAAGAAVPTVAAANGDLLAFQLVAPGVGWALLGQQLFWTASGGSQWREITPLSLGGGEIRAANFADGAHGWVISTAMNAAGELDYQLARTADGGQTWQGAPLALFTPGDAASMAGAVFLQFIDAHTGWLVVKQVTSPNFSLGTLFKTGDGGDHWTRLSLPTGAPVRFTNASEGVLDDRASGNGRFATNDGGQTWTAQPGASAPSPKGPGGEVLSGFSMANAEAGWAKSAMGKCDLGACVLLTRLLSTTDGGQTWTPVSLPSGQAAVEQSFAAPSAAPGQSVGGLRVTYNGQGFDACKNDGTLPASADMQTWYTSSPYGVWNLYLGGSSRAACGTLTRAYLLQLAQQGWLFIPTWVGPQAPCSNYRNRISFDVPTAYNQGVTEAFLARTAARNLGLTQADLSGSVIYYDVEYYTGDQPCRDAMKSFISGWAGELRGTGDQSGVYGAPCGQSLSDFAQVANVPDMIWLAWWQGGGYDPNASVFGFNACGLNNGLWVNQQRLRQYAGGHDESWGGVDFNIDSDRIDAHVATIGDGCAPTAGQVALFVYPNFGGQCAVKGLGLYPTSASLGLPGQSISSLRVSSGVTVTLCQGESYGPPCSVFKADQADLSSTTVGNNQVSSAMVITGTQAFTNQVFLPVNVLITSQAAPVPNGDFESGPTTWITSSTQGQASIVPSSVLTTAMVTAHSGQWAAWLGGPFSDTAYIQQTLLVPLTAPYLAYWQWIDSTEGACYFDMATVWVNNTVVDGQGLCQSTNTNGWVQRVINLSASAGISVTLKFQVQTNNSFASNLFLDDIGFQSAP